MDSDWDVVTALADSPGALVFAVLLGALWGSFFNVCIARIPLGKSVIRPGSHCFSCGASVRAYDNVPLLSYLWLRGRCRACGAHFSARYLLVEGLMAVLSGILFWQFVQNEPDTDLGIRLARFAVFFAFTGALLVLSFIDLDTQRLPDVITLPSTAVFFAAGFSLHMAPWLERGIGLVAGYVAVRIIADGYYYIRGREGLGLGDGKLLAMVGALLGWKALPVVVFAASLMGVLVSLPLLAWGAQKRRKAAPSAAPPETAPTLSERKAPGVASEAPAALSETPDTPSETPADTGVEPVQASGTEAEALRYTQVPFGPFLAASALAYLLLYDQLAPAVAAWLAPP